MQCGSKEVLLLGYVPNIFAFKLSRAISHNDPGNRTGFNQPAP
jgi:hypothetical protein